MDALLAAPEERFAQVEGIGPRRAASIHTFFQSADGRKTIKDLESLGLRLIEDRRETESTSGIAGKTIVVTGTLQTYGRDEIEAVIKRHGGKPSGSVSKKTDFVVAGEKAGSKLDKAKQLCVPVLSEEEFNKLIGK
jgi:DNA ligase (NAD+)